jgi:hypothetical protein
MMLSFRNRGQGSVHTIELQHFAVFRQVHRLLMSFEYFYQLAKYNTYHSGMKSKITIFIIMNMTKWWAMEPGMSMVEVPLQGFISI